MNIKIESNFLFSVSAIQYSATGELCITLNSDKTSPDGRYDDRGDRLFAKFFCGAGGGMGIEK